MDKEYLVPGSEISGNADPETQWNEQIFISIKQEIENDIDEEHSPGCDYMLPQHVNYYDSNAHVFEQVKEEPPDDEYPQSDPSEDNKIFSENKSLVNVIDNVGIEDEYTDEVSLIIKQENEDKIYLVTLKLEMPDDDDDDNEMMGNAEEGDGDAQSKLCGKTFKNSSNPLKNISEHQKMKINTLVYNDGDEHFNNHDDGFQRVSDVHRKKYPKCDLCGRQFKNVQGLKHHIRKSHKLKKKLPKRVTRINLKCTHCDLDFKNKSLFNKHMKMNHPAKEITYKCGTCVKLFKTRTSLIVHMKRTHYNFGRMFECWCGEQFHTPIHLSEHKSLQHSGKRKNQEYKCQECDAVFNSNRCLNIHVQRSHFDNGRIYESDSGSELRTPMHLPKFELRRHDRLSQSTYNGKVKCEYCHRTFTNDSYLMKHIKRIHYDYGKVFRCWCGKEYRTPFHLTEHMGMHNYRNTKVQCDTCQRFYKNKFSLVKHKIKIHGDYGKLYDCWCGKEFRTPSELADHKDHRHGVQIEDANSGKAQCVTCKSFFKNRTGLLRHIMRIHHDYGNRVIKRWCGKQFSTQSELADDKTQQSDSKVAGISDNKVQCVTCERFFTNRKYLLRHIRRIHHDYGSKVFKCWCGKVFRTPYKLTSHRHMCHDGQNDGTLNSRVQCDVCEKLYKSNRLLERHKKRMHCKYDIVL